MQKMQIDWQSLSERLTAALRASPLPLVEIAKRANVNYHAVYRMRRDKPAYQSKSALALCSFFGIYDPAATATVSETELADAIASTWDGTPEHGQFIMELLRCARRYRVKAQGAEDS